MIHEQAVIVRVGNDGSIKARVDRQGACDACKLKSGCGQKLLHEKSSKSCIEFDLENTLQAQVGDVVEVGIEEHALIRASLLMYLLPLVMMIVGATLGEAWFQSDAESPTILGAFLGLGSGFWLVRYIGQRMKRSDYHPSTLRLVHKSTP